MLQPTVLFDGFCNVCSKSVEFVAARDKKHRFRFVPLQSSRAADLLQQIGVSLKQIDAIVLVEQDRLYIKSSAALRIARYLSGLWPLLSIFLAVPTACRDFLYDVLAARRYSWFGQRHSCFVPTAESRKRSLK